MISRVAITLCLLLIAAVSVAQVPDQMAAQFVEEAELESSAAELAAQIGQMVAMQAGQFPEPLSSEYQDLMAAALEDDLLSERLHAFVRDRAVEDSLAQALAWRSNPAVKPVLERLYAVGDDPQAQVPIQIYAVTGMMGRHQVAEEHEALAAAYLERTGSADAVLDLMMDLVLVSARFSAELLETEMAPPALIRAQLEQQTEHLAAPLRAPLIYVFMDLEDQQIEAFVAASDSEAARYYNALGARALSYSTVGSVELALEAFLARVRELEVAGEIDLDEWRETIRRQMQEPTDDPTPENRDGTRQETDTK